MTNPKIYTIIIPVTTTTTDQMREMGKISSPLTRAP